MRDVAVSARLNKVSADEAYTLVSQFKNYPDHSDAIISVSVEPLEKETDCAVNWKVKFHNGVLCWSERNTLDPVARTISFDQIEGDVETFFGEWKVAQEVNAVNVSFKATFDLGIPTLNAFLEPVAEKILAENIRSILKGFFGEEIEFHRMTH